MRLKDVATSGVTTLAPTDSIDKAAERMTRADVSALPIVEQKLLVGIITETDFLKELVAAFSS